MANRDRFPDREFRNADQLFIPFVWNSVSPEKNAQHRYLKLLKAELLANQL